jgi:hypothetical protein
MPGVTISLTCDTAPATNPGNWLQAGAVSQVSENGWFLPT